jgi:hypothetical protein
MIPKLVFNWMAAPLHLGQSSELEEMAMVALGATSP